jgi:DNA-binding MarR family transcriptional regulator/N-acetylglutamate synthase-like GNAT family acetyltransferase
MDLINELGPLAFASRLRRLSERLHRDGSRIYEKLGIDFQARWFPLLYLLAGHSPLAVTEIADALRLTHPAVIQTASAMSEAGLIESSKDEEDERRRLLQLTAKGRSTADSLKPIWDVIEATTRELLDHAGPRFLEQLTNLETELDSRSMYDRVMARVRRSRVNDYEILRFASRFSRDFRDLNVEWLEEYFEVEPEDEKILSDPQGFVIEPGGEIFLVRLDGRIVGTAAMLKHGRDTFEMAKMCVTKEYRGVGIGLALAEKVIAEARERGAARIFLLTSPKLVVARGLYHKLGFRETDARPVAKEIYRRCTVAMQLELK